MNPTEQRNHKTSLQALEAATTTAFNALAEAIGAERREREQGDLDVAAIARAAVGDERRLMMNMADKQIDYIATRDRLVNAALDRLTFDYRLFVGRTFWSRLNWLLFGN